MRQPEYRSAAKMVQLAVINGNKPTKQEIVIAKNYLNEDELNVLNRMVTSYLELAELQAMNRKPMYMKDWIQRLDDFVNMTGNSILQNAGTVSHQEALKKANAEYEKYKEQTKNELSETEKHFIKHIETTTKKLNQKKPNK